MTLVTEDGKTRVDAACLTKKCIRIIFRVHVYFDRKCMFHALCVD